MPLKFEIRPACIEDAEAIGKLFYNTIHKINIRDYTPAQIAAWAPENIPVEGWIKKQTTHQVFVADHDGTIVGFAELETNGHLDCFFCHHEYQRLGIGSALMSRIIETSRDMNNVYIFSEVSITARPFFESSGFKVVHEQQILCRGEWMTNFAMRRNHN